MSDLGAIFHVKKAGVQYDAHAYTTTDECPEPNLKIKFKGSPAYIKLEAKGSGDVPCYVKTKAGNTYQVKKETIPTGTIKFKSGQFTVPMGITVLEMYYNGDTDINYVGVTPGSTHTLDLEATPGDSEDIPSNVYILCSDHNVYWYDAYYEWDTPLHHDYIHISWSPEINKIKPSVTDY